MARDAAATQARILDAAIEEFAEHGLAGGRVERVAATAGVNIKSLYLYFTSKDSLFDAAAREVFGRVGAGAPFNSADLPEFAGQLFDQICANPAAVRLNLWRMLQDASAGPDDTDRYVAELEAAKRRAPTPAIPWSDLFIMIPAMASAWLLTSRDVRRAAGALPATEDRRRQFRASLVTAVAALVDLDRDTRSVSVSTD